MTKHEKNQNANFWRSQIRLLNDGGTFLWYDVADYLTLQNGKLLANSEAILKKAKATVSKKEALKLFALSK